MVFSKEINMINIYGPYHYKELFWGLVERDETFLLPNLILAGDLNFTLNAAEIWGKKERLGPLAIFSLNSLLISIWLTLLPLVQGQHGGMVGLVMMASVNDLTDF